MKARQKKKKFKLDAILELVFGVLLIVLGVLVL